MTGDRLIIIIIILKKLRRLQHRIPVESALLLYTVSASEDDRPVGMWGSWRTRSKKGLTNRNSEPAGCACARSVGHGTLSGGHLHHPLFPPRPLCEDVGREGDDDVAPPVRTRSRCCEALLTIGDRLRTFFSEKDTFDGFNIVSR